MRFKLIYGNHSQSGVHLSETFLLIKYSLENLGHLVDLEQNITPGFVNIFIDPFTYDFLSWLEKAIAKDKNTKVLIVGTEYITGETFNTFSAPEIPSLMFKNHYDSKDHWKKRYEVFEKVAKLSVGIWHVAEQQVDSFRNKFQKDKVFFFPHGYVPQLECVTHRNIEYKDIDVIFTGSPTKYRDQVLMSIIGSGLKVKWLPISTPGYLRDEYTARSKLAVNIRQDALWEHPSHSRFQYHVINKSLLITEECKYKTEVGNYVIHADPNDVISQCKERIEARDFMDIAQEKYQRYKCEMPMTLYVEELVEKTFGSA